MTEKNYIHGSNRIPEKMMTINGKTMSITDFCRIHNKKKATVMTRLNRGATDEEALFKPSRYKKRGSA